MLQLILVKLFTLTAVKSLLRAVKERLMEREEERERGSERERREKERE